jgi:hypothetical protein
VHANLGQSAVHQGDYDRAAARFREGLALLHGLGDQRDNGDTARCLAGLARVAASAANPETAARLAGAARARLDTTGVRLEPIDRADCEENLTAASAAADAPAWAAAFALGQQMPPDQAIDVALTAPVALPTAARHPPAASDAQ